MSRRHLPITVLAVGNFSEAKMLLQGVLVLGPTLKVERKMAFSSTTG